MKCTCTCELVGRDEDMCELSGTSKTFLGRACATRTREPLTPPQNAGHTPHMHMAQPHGPARTSCRHGHTAVPTARSPRTRASKGLCAPFGLRTHNEPPHTLNPTRHEKLMSACMLTHRVAGRVEHEYAPTLGAQDQAACCPRLQACAGACVEALSQHPGVKHCVAWAGICSCASRHRRMHCTCAHAPTPEAGSALPGTQVHTYLTQQ